MSPRRRNERNNSPWSSKRSRSRSYSPSTRRYRRSPRNESRKRSRERDNKYSKREQSNNYRSAYLSSKAAITSSTIQPPVPPPPTVHSISASAYTVSEPDYKNYASYTQYNTVQPEYNPATITPQFNMAYPPPPSWSTATPDIMAAPPPWPVAPPVPTPVHQMQPVQPPAPVNKENIYETATREAAVAQEIQNQREELKKQRNDYLRKSETMKKELKMLKEQMVDLVGGGDAPPSPTTKRYIDENEKLQGQIQKKITTIENVLDMLNGIIGEEEKKENAAGKPKSESSDSTASSSSSSSSSESDDDSSPERLKTKVIESMKSRKESLKIEEKKKDKRENNGISDSKYNYVFYDPEMNWCKVCNVFPKSAKDYLNHMHSKEHIDKVDVPPTPWHDDFHSDEFPHIEHSQTKRVPIRGLQFFVPSRAWFCKLCKVWMGDLHCASLHLKSRTHSSKYDEFFQKNLTYEVEWMAERQKALGKVGRHSSPGTGKSGQTENVFDNIPLKLGGVKNSEDKHSKSKKSDSKKSKSKKKRSKKHKKGSSSSTSNSSSSESETGLGADDRASSIRVTMRNIKKPEDEIKDDLTSKGGYNPMEIDEIEKKKDELMMTQWNTPQPIISESEKKLLEQLKGKLKNKPQEEQVKKESEPKKSVNRDHIRKRSPGQKERSPVSRNRSNRSRSRDRWRGNRNDRRSRSINRYNRRSRDRDRDRDRRTRSRDRDNRRSRSRRRNGSRNRSPYNWRGSRRSISRDRRRWSTSKSKSRSRSSSTSRRSSRVEKPLVRYPEFRPRISENESKRKSDREKKLAGTNEEEGDRKKSPNSNSSNKKSSAATTSYAGGKKLPFIGRMPVLAKKQQEQNNENNSADLNDDMMNSKSMENNYANFDNDGVYYDDLMPDPMQYASIMGAPPPPPPPMHVIDDKDMLPPGIDEMETEFVPKPISEAPAPRKGPLPRDFEEALNIIFPDEVKVVTDNKMDLPLEMNTPLQPPEMNLPLQSPEMNLPLQSPGMNLPLQPPEILPQEVETTSFILQSDVESAVIESSVIEEEIITDPIEIELHHIEMPPPIELPPPIEIPLTTEKSTVLDDPVIDEFIIQSSNNPETLLSSTKPTTTAIIENTTSIALPEETLPIIDTSQENNHSSKILDTAETKESSSIPVPNSKQKEWRPEELDDLAMLGIDADDLAAQCI